MGEVRLYIITCDATLSPKCEKQFNPDKKKTHFTTITDQRRTLGLHGWHVSKGGNDVCPACWKKCNGFID